mmetsp:Transcript_10379/g.16963  ORF Transcript_10379/g.16963 Transcript_10379/m.16963 type:complete len:80 (+) Transcript_10379:957-1196(+)
MELSDIINFIEEVHNLIPFCLARILESEDSQHSGSFKLPQRLVLRYPGISTRSFQLENVLQFGHLAEQATLYAFRRALR